ncbi:MAG: hypothetical protein DRI57_09380 [Deltaproteobacteria bacterium]|nr:MAG: hypothetical protein DRI57_09380 [Deltaproteobacteria bacterium]
MQVILVVNSQMPLSFRASRSNKNIGTLPYIPGTSLLGGLAAAYIRMRQGSSGFEDEFARFFTSGDISFGNLYPANFQSDKSKNDDLADDELSIRPIPATVRSCKDFSGFLFQNKKDDDDDEKHGVFDELIPWTLFALSRQKATDVFDAGRQCSVCHKRTAPFSGFYRRNFEMNAIGASNPKRRMITRTGISRKRGAVMEEILYHREVLSENQDFWGILDVQDDTLWDDFEEFFDEAFDNEAVYLGNNKTRGMGKIGHTSLIPITEPDDTEDNLKKRVGDFGSKLKQMAAEHNLTAPHAYYIPITLQSDAILRDDLMRYQSAITPDDLKKAWNLKDMELIYHNVSTSRVMGWNPLTGLPRADGMAMAMGSVFLFGFNGNADDLFWQILSEIQTKGIGERRHHGFGRIMIAEPFHLEVNPL